jgi:hypothetical protein
MPTRTLERSGLWWNGSIEAMPRWTDELTSLHHADNAIIFYERGTREPGPADHMFAVEEGLIRVRWVARECGGCPQQWVGYTADGLQVYFRYRWGTFRVRLLNWGSKSDFTYDLMTGSFGRDELDGMCSWEECLSATQGIINWSEAEWLPDYGHPPEDK